MASLSERNRQRPHPAEEESHTLREQIESCHNNKDIDGLKRVALALTGKVDVLQHIARQGAAIDEHVREKLEVLTAPEHYAVVVTRVERNGSLAAEVAGLGHSRVQVGVHPDVDPKQLVSGATGLVARERNCLLKVISDTGRWTEVGTVQRPLGSGDRILVRHRDAEIAVDVAHRLRGTPLIQGDLVGFDSTVGMAYQRLEPPKREQLFDENVTDDFSHLAGLEPQIARIKRHIDFRIRYPELAARYRIKGKCGILLQGPPGNGKTRIARCCAGYARQLQPGRPCRFMHVSGSSIYSMWFGQSEQHIIERFLAVREAASDGLVIMFWDELDAIAKMRSSDHGSGAPDRVLNTYLSQLDGVVPLGNVVVLFATNRPDVLDPGVFRPGRIDQKIEIPTPNRRAAGAILRSYLSRDLPLEEQTETDELTAPLLSRLFAPNGQYAEVARVKLSDGRQIPVAGRQLLSGALLENVVAAAAESAAVREAETGRAGLGEEDLTCALDSEMIAATSVLTAGNVKRYVRTVPQDSQPIAVDHLLPATASTFVRSGG